MAVSSSVALIVGADGCSRVVVTQRWRMMFHVERGERLFVVPGLKVVEPVQWADVPRIVAAALAHADLWRTQSWHRYFLHRLLAPLGLALLISPIRATKSS